MKVNFERKRKTDRSPLTKNRMHWLFDGTHPFGKCVALALVLNLIVEMLCRRSVVDGFLHIIESPLVFLYNSLIILLTLVPALLFVRQNFYLYFASVIWLGLGGTNCVLLGMRTTPLSAIDFSILVSALNIVGIYLNPFQILLIIVGVLVLLCVSVFVFKHTSRMRPKYAKATAIVSVTGIIFALLTLISIKSNVISTSFPSLAEAYDDYGFAYCFSVSVIDRGIDEPDGYSELAVNTIIEKLPETNDIAEEDLPNIIFIQMESFFDVNRLTDYCYTEDPVPYWTFLRENYPGGLLTVPSVGAGTANTEFEIISGMSLDYFGAGEYPYKTILQETTAESIAYNLKELGYSTHAIHNHTYDFYDRNFIYTHLGFDTFTPVEFMPNVERNFINWAKDNIIPTEVMKVLDATEEKDFVYAITVQPHGKYPNDLTGYDTDLDYVYTGEDEDPIVHEQLVYFLSELGESDAAIKTLLDSLSNYEEKTVVVIFGDHLPALSFANDGLSEGSLLDTEYVVWSNYDLGAEDRNLSSFQLNAYVLGLIGVNNGNIVKLHQSSESNEEYLSDLEVLEYDMLYGEKYAYENNALPYPETEIEYGVFPVEITGIYTDNGILHVYGNNFTAFSRIKIGDSILDTVLISDSELMLISPISVEDDYVENCLSVVQVDSNGIIITETTEVIIDASLLVSASMSIF